MYNDRNVDYNIKRASENIVLRSIKIIIRKYLNERSTADAVLVDAKKSTKSEAVTA
jgi:hypothetical protein